MALWQAPSAAVATAPAPAPQSDLWPKTPANPFAPLPPPPRASLSASSPLWPLCCCPRAWRCSCGTTRGACVAGAAWCWCRHRKSCRSPRHPRRKTKRRQLSHRGALPQAQAACSGWLSHRGAAIATGMSTPSVPCPRLVILLKGVYTRSAFLGVFY